MAAVLMDCVNVVDPLQVFVAANAALNYETAATMRTRSLETEMLLCLSGGRSIRTALATFGVSSSTTRLLVGLFGTSDGNGDGEASAADVVAGLVSGTEVAPAELMASSDAVVVAEVPPVCWSCLRRQGTVDRN